MAILPCNGVHCNGVHFKKEIKVNFHENTSKMEANKFIQLNTLIVEGANPVLLPCGID